MGIEAIIWYLVLLDSVIANLIAFCCKAWYRKKFKKFSKYFPLVKGWTLLYLILVLWVGFSLWRLGVLSF
jgi:hypothetical protein